MVLVFLGVPVFLGVVPVFLGLCGWCGSVGVEAACALMVVSCVGAAGVRCKRLCVDTRATGEAKDRSRGGSASSCCGGRAAGECSVSGDVWP